GETLIAGIGRGDRLDLFAGHALDRVGPQIEVGFAQARLQLERALGIAQPVVRDLAQRFHDIGHLAVLVGDLACLARLEVGGERLAALLHDAGGVARELLHVRGAARDGFRWGSHGEASIHGSRWAQQWAASLKWTLSLTPARRMVARQSRRSRGHAINNSPRAATAST